MTMPDEIKKQVEDAAETYVKLKRLKEQEHFEKPHIGPLDSKLAREECMFIYGAQFMWDLMSKREDALEKYADGCTLELAAAMASKAKLRAANKELLDALEAARSALSCADIVLMKHGDDYLHHQGFNSPENNVKRILAKHKEQDGKG